VKKEKNEVKKEVTQLEEEGIQKNREIEELKKRMTEESNKAKSEIEQLKKENSVLKERFTRKDAGGVEGGVFEGATLRIKNLIFFLISIFFSSRYLF
jgi:hypothetical protein